jgi:hypothetical protein
MTKINVTFIRSVTKLKPSVMLPEPVEINEAVPQERRRV